MLEAVQLRRLIAVTFACAAVVFIATVVVASGRAQAGQRHIVHTCSAADHQYLDTVSSNMVQLGYWSDSLVHNDVAPGVVVKQARAEAAQIDATRPTDGTLEQSRSLLRSMFMEYARAVYARSRGRSGGLAMGSAYRLANDVHDLLVGAQPTLAGLGCDPAPLLK
ncbi:MAG TPA: hypothetical protein VGN27_12250 [Gaiellaceae bacterium]|jgi:hypothetical protein|nr:hypothetical protein [Gaiellaceae bacterium]